MSDSTADNMSGSTADAGAAGPGHAGQPGAGQFGLSAAAAKRITVMPVSYTHLTLPTIREV